MPPKRRGAQAKSAAPATKPDPPKPFPPPKTVSAPPPPPPIPPPSIPESDATKVRKEWTKFIDTWYEPQKTKLVEKLQKDLLVKYKDLGSAKDTQKLREMELFEKLDAIAQQLAQPARKEWERRLELAHLREDMWDDMSGEEQQAVLSVFVGFFADDVEDMGTGHLSAEPFTVQEDSIPEDPLHRGRQTIPPTPTRQTFEFVNPTSFFTDTITPPNPSKNLPALSMDHLATLGPSNTGRSAEPVSASVGGVLGFQSWASEVGIVTQQPPPQPAKPSTSAQTLSTRPRAIDMTSRQTSTASSLSSPPLKSSSPQSSPPNLTAKFSPPINAETHPLGKRYIGPVILEEDPDPMDEELLKSKMADEYQQYKISLRIQMIYQFHAEAAEFEIKLFETLLADQSSTKESRTRAVLEHETSMMRLREQKEEERKRLCAEEREKRREEIRQHLALRRSPQNREIDSKANPSKSLPDKSSAPQRPGKTTHQKENVPFPPPVTATASSSKLEPPSMLRKSNSMLSQDEVSANEALFANAMVMMQGKPAVSVLTPAQASLNESLFSNAAAMLAVQGQAQPGSVSKNLVPPPSIMKKSNSARSQEYDVPHITVSFAEPPAISGPELTSATAKGKKGKKGQSGTQFPPVKPVTLTEELGAEMDAEPPPPVPSLWDTAANVAKNVWDAASASLAEPPTKLGVSSVEDVRAPEHEAGPATAPASSKGNVNAKKSAAGTTKKGKKVTIMEEPDVDADPIVSPPPAAKKATKGAWGTVNKSKAPAVAEECDAEPLAPPPLPTVTSARGKKAAEPTTKSAQKPRLKVTISEELESEFEPISAPVPVPVRTNKTKFAWDASTAMPSASTTSSSSSAQASSKATQQQQAAPRHAAINVGHKPVRVDAVPDPRDAWLGTGSSMMPGALTSVPSEGTEEDEEEGDASAWFKPENMNYWANFMASSPEAEVVAHAHARSQSQTQVVSPSLELPQTAEQIGKHVRWTPTVSGESDDEDGFGDEELATSMWMQYAISGADIPGLPNLGGAPEEPVLLSEAQHDTRPSASAWEHGKGKKKSVSTAGDGGHRAQQTSVFDRAALTGQWPKMESWLSPPTRGQNSGSTHVF